MLKESAKSEAEGTQTSKGMTTLIPSTSTAITTTSKIAVMLGKQPSLLRTNFSKLSSKQE